MITHEDISRRAREIWEREGRPEGRDKEHWLQAEAELRGHSLNSQNDQPIARTNDSLVSVVAGDLKEDGARRRSSRRVK